MIGLGYVGLANAVLLAQHNEVVGVDVSEEKLVKLKNNLSPIEDKEIEHFLQNFDLNIRYTQKYQNEVVDSDFVILSLPTNFDEVRGSFDTDILEDVIGEVHSLNSQAQIVVKSTVPFGFTRSMQNKIPGLRILFAPEFLREGSALHDNLYPSRIIIGSDNANAESFAEMMVKGARAGNIKIIYTNSGEAEAIKLFSNSYLAMRVSFFNELDNFALCNDLDTNSIIRGVCADTRIGENYNNPSFGYGGYCLPKDTKQLEKSFEQTPMSLISAITRSNEKRKNFIVNEILHKSPNCIGMYRLSMKAGSDNFRESAAGAIVTKLIELNQNVIIFEPNTASDSYLNARVIKDLSEFKDMADIIIANRMSDDLFDVQEKVFSRDIYGSS